MSPTVKMMSLLCSLILCSCTSLFGAEENPRKNRFSCFSCGGSSSNNVSPADNLDKETKATLARGEKLFKRRQYLEALQVFNTISHIIDAQNYLGLIYTQIPSSDLDLSEIERRFHTVYWWSLAINKGNFTARVNLTQLTQGLDREVVKTIFLDLLSQGLLDLESIEYILKCTGSASVWDSISTQFPIQDGQQLESEAPAELIANMTCSSQENSLSE